MKICSFCGSNQVKKDGKQQGKQRYKCKQCSKRFTAHSKPDLSQIWIEYTDGKQTLEQLSKRYKCSKRTIQRYLKQVQPKCDFAQPKTANIIMDTTYFGRNFGIMVLYDSITKQTVWANEVKYETNALYLFALNEIKEQGIEIQSIICDGRKGLVQLLPNIPVQLCQFHQVATVNRYLTRKPKSIAGQTLRALILTLKNSSKCTFRHAFEQWYLEHKDYLNERSINEKTGKLSFTHRKLRSAYLSIQRNMDYLFTFEEYPDLHIPKTTNLLEGLFGDMKQKLHCHQGMKKDNKILFIKDYLSK